MIKTNLGKISITNKGEYSAATTYETLDVVSFNGSSYMAKQQTVGNSPENTNYWQLLAAKGDTPVKGVDYFTQADIASLPMPDLSGYALASDVYSKDDVDDMVAAIESSALKRIIVQELPAVNISSNAIYMIRNLSAEGQNQYDEFMWNENDGSGRWEYIGNTQVDLTGYATESWVNNQGFLKTHQDISGKANSADLATVATTGDYTDLINTPNIPVMPTLANVATSGSYNDLSNKPSIPTKVSDLTNDAGYLTTHQDISGKQNVLPTGTSGQVLTYDGSAWVADDAPTGVNNVKVYPDIVLTNKTYSSGAFLDFLSDAYLDTYVNHTHNYIYRVKINNQENAMELGPMHWGGNGTQVKSVLFNAGEGYNTKVNLTMTLDLNNGGISAVYVSNTLWYYDVPETDSANKIPFWISAYNLQSVTVPDMIKRAYSSATSGQILQYDGSAWVAANIPASNGGVTYTAGDGIEISNNEISSVPEVEIFSGSWSNYNTPSQDFISFCNDVKQSYDNNENKLYFLKSAGQGLLQVFYLDTTIKEIKVIDAQGQYILYSVTLTGTDITNVAIKSGYQYFEDHMNYATTNDVARAVSEVTLPEVPEEEGLMFALTEVDGEYDWFQLTDWITASEQDQQIVLGDYTIDLGSGLSLEEDTDEFHLTLDTSGSSGGATYTAGNGINIDANNVISKQVSAVPLYVLLDCIMTGSRTGQYNQSAAQTAWSNNTLLNANTEQHIANLKAYGMTYVNDGTSQALMRAIVPAMGDDVASTFYFCSNSDMNVQYTISAGTSSASRADDYMTFGMNNSPTLIIFNPYYDYGSPYRWFIIKEPYKRFQNHYFNSQQGLTSHSIAAAIDEVASRIPAAPSSDGDYVLKCSVVSGVPTYTWETAT